MSEPTTAFSAVRDTNHFHLQSE